MANEVRLSGNLVYNDGISLADLGVNGRVATVATKRQTRTTMTVTTAEIAIPLAGIAAPGLAIFRNRDLTNYIDLRVASGGAKFARLKPDTAQDGTGGFAILELGPDAQVPYAIANTASCVMDLLIVST